MRWEIIETYLDEGDETLLDIGCAEGYFTSQAAEIGLDARGIDISEGRIAMARGKYRSKVGKGLEFQSMEISEENIDSLPRSDVVLFLTVHHHFRYEEGLTIFKALARKSEKMFYEPPGTRFLGRRELEPEESIDVYTEFIESTLEGRVEILDVTLVPRVDYDDRRDPLFVLDVSEYT
jgi:SAM-dependent methyltransferase